MIDHIIPSIYGPMCSSCYKALEGQHEREMQAVNRLLTAAPTQRCIECGETLIPCRTVRTKYGLVCQPCYDSGDTGEPFFLILDHVPDPNPGYHPEVPQS